VNSDRPKLTDWVNLPEDVRTVSLWDTLHDGDLMSLQSDRFARTVTLQFDVAYVREFNHLPEDARFVLVLTGVQSVRATGSEPWPGGFSTPAGASRDEEAKLIGDYQAKWREESQSWTEFERLVARDNEVGDATLALTDNAVALKLGLLGGRDQYYEAIIRADRITFSVGSRQLTLEEFVTLGEKYWEAFAKRQLPDVQ
jgi:hypothetical protein